MIAAGTKLKPGAFYRITKLGPDPEPTLQVGDVVHCEVKKRRAVDPQPDCGWWFADYGSHHHGFQDEWYGTIIAGLEEVPAPDGAA